MPVLMEDAAESVVSSYVKVRDLVRSHERGGQWLERAGVRDALMRPMRVCCDTKSHVVSELVEEVWLMPET